MGVGEAHALARELVQAGGGHLRRGVKGTDVAVAEIVAEDDDNIGWSGGGGEGGGYEGSVENPTGH